MSRIGKKPIPIPAGVEVSIADRLIEVKGAHGSLNFEFSPQVNVVKKDAVIYVTRAKDDRFSRSLHGLTRNLIANMITGVTDKFSKKLELKGVGYRAQTDGHLLTLSLGFSHPVEYTAPEGIEFTVEKNTLITISGIDKQKVGQVAADLRVIRPPEPYKGKGIRYFGEIVRRKAGKATKTVRS